MSNYWDAFYGICYFSGIQTVRLLHRMGRIFSFFLQPVFFFLRRTIGGFFGHLGKDIKNALVVLKNGVCNVGKKVKEAWRIHPLKGVWQVVRLPYEGLRRFPRITRLLARLTAVVLAIATLLSTLQYWQQLTYAVALESDGEVWGYITDESVLQIGRTMALERIDGAKEVQELEAKPAMALSMVHESDVLDAAGVCDLLLKKSNLPLTTAGGVYVDGRLCGVVYNARRAQAMLDEILEDSCQGQTGVTASFFQTVEILEGLYPASSVVSPDELKTELTSQGAGREYYEVQQGQSWYDVAVVTGVPTPELRQLNPDIETLTAGDTLLVGESEPHLQVLVTGTVQYEVEIPYTTKRVADAAEYKGYERTRVVGKNGKSLVTATATYLDGEIISSVITSSKVIQEPVDHIIAYGTKVVTSKKYKGGPHATGRFIWPLPYTRYITQHFGTNGHGGTDISYTNVYGQDIIAADGGVVVVAAWRQGTSYGSYGKYVLIDHGGGYQTLYAHCSELLVQPGDIVKQGQVIAKVGNTGRSTGPHLHFELQVNGRRINPLLYVDRY